MCALWMMINVKAMAMVTIGDEGRGFVKRFIVMIYKIRLWCSSLGDPPHLLALFIIIIRIVLLFQHTFDMP